MPNPLQFGFVKEHGSIPAIYTLKETINYYNENKSTVYTAFLDNEKAFDKIWHDGLLKILADIGITGKVWNLIYTSYKQPKAQIRCHGNLSGIITPNQGVGQGRVMSSWMFLVYINYRINELYVRTNGLTVGHINILTIL